MAKKKLVVGNWKMHHNVAAASILAHQMNQKIKATEDVEIVLCPSFVALQPLAKEIDAKKFALGAQNAHYIDEGPYTGEVAAAMLTDLVQYVIVGHSERRLHFNETDQVIARKVAAVVRNGMVPILCIGENLSERQDNETDLVIQDQLAAGLVMLTSEEVNKIVVAYEPVWAIGTGEIAKPDQIKQAIKIIRNVIQEVYGNTPAKNLRVLYGGSVAAEHAPGYLAIKDLNGFLVGGASLNPAEFASIVASAQGRSPARRPAPKTKSEKS